MMITHTQEMNGIFDNWLKTKYVGYGKVKYIYWLVYEYRRITFYLSEENKVKIDMIEYMNTMVNIVSTKLEPNDTVPDQGIGYFFAAENSEKLIKYNAQ